AHHLQSVALPAPPLGRRPDRARHERRRGLGIDPRRGARAAHRRRLRRPRREALHARNQPPDRRRETVNLPGRGVGRRMSAPSNIRTRANPRWRLRLLLALVALLAFAYLGWKFRKEMPRLLEAKPLGIALIVATFLPMRLLTSEVQRIGLRALGHVISTYESFMVSMINAYGNLLLPRAGLGLPAVYL